MNTTNGQSDAVRAEMEALAARLIDEPTGSNDDQDKGQRSAGHMIRERLLALASSPPAPGGDAVRDALEMADEVFKRVIPRFNLGPNEMECLSRDQLDLFNRTPSVIAFALAATPAPAGERRPAGIEQAFFSEEMDVAAVEREAPCKCGSRSFTDDKCDGCGSPPPEMLTPPAEAREPVGVTDAMVEAAARVLGNLIGADERNWRAYENEARESLEAAWDAQPRDTPRDSGDARDAARYRWLKANDNAYLLAEDVIDDAIDAAMQSPTGETT